MIPDYRLSTTNIDGDFVEREKYSSNDSISYEWGGIAINDASEGLMCKVWIATIDASGASINIISDTETLNDFYTGTNITSVSLAFDRNMNPAVSFIENSTSKLKWYDAEVGGYTVTTLDSNVVSTRLSMDDKRFLQSASSDIILGYIKSGALYFRAQRDRFSVEYLLKDNLGNTKLLEIGMGDGLRFLFQLV